MTRLTLVLCLVVSSHAFAQYTVETVPNQRRIDGSMVTNPDGILSSGAIVVLDSLLADIENKTTAQVAVVAIRSIGGVDIFDFAQELFNTWGIGQKNNNGVLVLLVKDDRTIRIHTGGGVQGILTDIRCKRIQRDYMVPSFKDDDYDAGIIAGVQRIHEMLTDPSKAKELVYVDERLEMGQYEGWMLLIAMVYGIPFLFTWWNRVLGHEFADPRKRHKSQYEAMLLTQRAWLIEFGLIPALIVFAYVPGSPVDAAGLCLLTLYFYFIGTLVHRLFRERRVLVEFMEQKRYYDATVFIGSTTRFWFFRALVFPIPFALYFIFHLTRKAHYRNHPRKCKLCESNMKKLSEKDEDQFLDEKKQFEEKIASIDYDVWLCPSCKATREWQYPHRNAEYELCPSCKTKASRQIYRRTVVNATYTAKGEGKEVYECKFCHETRTVPFLIPILADSSSDSSDSSSSGSSSGSDFGGGSSDGGGSSSSW